MSRSEAGSRAAFSALSKIYRLYDDYMDHFSLACRRYCADCCTTGVTLTSLEGRFIYDFLDTEKRADLYERMLSHADAPRFQPAMSTNRFAQLCARHLDPPEERFPAEAGVCPLLEKESCTIYRVRPFGCRCMISTTSCRQSGRAVIDAFMLTVNTLFLQVIEHLDRSGYFGNFIDVMIRLTPGGQVSPADTITVPNQPAAVLMVPPEHQGKVRPLLDALNHILAEAEKGFPGEGAPE